jgi:hypothetical protein
VLLLVKKGLKTMTKLFKLTTIDNKTRPGENNECQWGEGVTHTASGEGYLCGPGFIHAYATSPEVAILLNPIHADYQPFNLWECEGEVVKRDRILKVGCTKLTTIRQIPFTLPTPNQLVRAAIYMAKEVYKEPNWNQWADNWLDGKDRTKAAASIASIAAEAARAAASIASIAAEAARAAAARAAEAAARAAVIAARAAEEAAAARAAVIAARAAEAAEAAAEAAKIKQLDIVSIVSKAFKDEGEYANLQTSK